MNDDWRDELEAHLAMRAERNEQQGMAPADARRAAERAFGNRTRIAEEVRAVHVPVWLDPPTVSSFAPCPTSMNTNSSGSA